jgi:hypothetical protein
LFIEDENAPAASEPRVSRGISNIKDRKKDFDPHFTLTDESPVSKESAHLERIAEDKLKHVKMMDANWTATDQSPTAANQKENAGPVAASPTRPGAAKGPLSETTNSQRVENLKGIAVGGDGMGGKKGTSRGWGIGDESDGEGAGGLNGAGSAFRKGKKPGLSTQTSQSDFWDF